jgi:hypothetical protein
MISELTYITNKLCNFIVHEVRAVYNEGNDSTLLISGHCIGLYFTQIIDQLM